MPTQARPLTIVHAVFSSRLAGGERHCVDLARAQAALGHDVHVVGPGKSAVREVLGPSVAYHGLPAPLLRGLRLRRLARTLKADVVHGHLGPACKAVATVGTATRIGTLHVGFKAHHHQAMDGLICVNTAQRQRLAGYEGQHAVIFNWAPERDPGAAMTPSDLRAELGLDPQQLLVGSVGRLCPSKGMDVLVSAFRAHAPADAVLAILGEGDHMAELRRLAAGDPRVRLLGFRSDVDDALKAMDLFVSPSREEAFPLAILEAMRAGVPVISTATQGPLEMLARQPDAQIVPIADATAMGTAIAERLARLRAVPRHLRAAVPYEVSAYSRGAAVDRTVAFYRQVLARAPLGEAQSTPGVSSDVRSGVGHA
ncbi:MAG: glycosyltransferase family 4 protein [Burkholderiaceae bacterium]